jgi:hypothetical protein
VRLGERERLSKVKKVGFDIILKMSGEEEDGD